MLTMVNTRRSAKTPETTSPPTPQSISTPEVKPEPGPGKGKGRRPSNFTAEEDEILCRAFVATSLDPIRGCGQKREVFWASVFKKYKEIYQRDVEVQVTSSLDMRTAASISARWGRKLQPDVTKFVSILRSNPIPSGQSPDQWRLDMEGKFAARHGHPFLLKKCLLILERLPKFDYKTVTPTTPPAPDIDNSDAQSAFSNVSTGMTRPCGTKKAKARLSTQEQRNRNDKKRIKAMELLSSSIDGLNATFTLENERNYCLSMFKTLKDIGLDAEAGAYLHKLKKLEKPGAGEDDKAADEKETANLKGVAEENIQLPMTSDDEEEKAEGETEGVWKSNYN